jgi:dihydropyrimidinase
MLDYLITGGVVVTPEGELEGGVAIQGETIVALGSAEGLPREATTIIDAQGGFIIPGFVDVHTHIGVGPESIPFDVSWQAQWESESEGAIHGGVTTIRSNITIKGPYLPVIDRYIAWAEENSYVDFNLYPAYISPDHPEEMLAMAAKGMPAWKCFYDAYQGEEGARMGLASTDSGSLWQTFETLGKIGYPGLVMIHAEDYGLYRMLETRLKAEGRNGLAAWSDSRPNICEAMKIEAAAMICEQVAKLGGCPLYIVHVSTKEGVDIVKKYQDRGVPVIAETLPCFLTHTKHMDDQVGVWGKVNPPFREVEDRERMWEALRTGVVSCMGTDQVSYKQEDKENGLGKHGSIWEVPPGISGGLQHWLPVLFSEGYHGGRLGIRQIVRVCCENNARTFGLYPRKGVLRPGSDADIVVVDPNKTAVIGDGFYKGLNKTYSIYWGKEVRGLPVLTMSRGEIVMRDGKTVSQKGRGKFVPGRAEETQQPQGHLER